MRHLFSSTVNTHAVNVCMIKRVVWWLQAFRVDDLPIESGMLTDALDNAQRKVEAYFFDIRKQLWEYDQVRAHFDYVSPGNETQEINIF